MAKTLMGYIMDQPRVLQKTLDNRAAFCDGLVKVFRERPVKKVYMIGSGTSYHVSLATRYYFEKYLNVEVQVVIPTLFTNYEKVNNNGVYKNEEILVVAISQSGTSYSTIDALKKARGDGLYTVVFTEALGSPIVEFADTVLHMQCEVEEIPPETKGYTTAVLAAYLWMVEIGRGLSVFSQEEYSQKIEDAQACVAMVPKALEEARAWFERNKYELLMAQKIDIAGYGANYVTALEGTLKVGETFKRKAAGFELEELIHGTEMGYDTNNYAFLTGADEKEFGRMLDIKAFLEQITPHVFVVTSEAMENENGKACVLSVKTTTDLSPILNVIPFQMYSGMATEAVGIDTSVYPFSFQGIGHSHDE